MFISWWKGRHVSQLVEYAWVRELVMVVWKLWFNGRMEQLLKSQLCYIVYVNFLDMMRKRANSHHSFTHTPTHSTPGNKNCTIKYKLTHKWPQHGKTPIPTPHYHLITHIQQSSSSTLTTHDIHQHLSFPRDLIWSSNTSGQVKDVIVFVKLLGEVVDGVHDLNHSWHKSFVVFPHGCCPARHL